MVRRKLNIPAGKIGNKPVFWLRELVTAKWFCHACKSEQPVATVAIEVFLREAMRVQKEDLPELRKLKEFRGMKKYICVNCAVKMLDEVSDDVKLLQSQGVDGFKLMKDI